MNIEDSVFSSPLLMYPGLCRELNSPTPPCYLALVARISPLDIKYGRFPNSSVAGGCACCTMSMQYPTHPPNCQEVKNSCIQFGEFSGCPTLHTFLRTLGKNCLNVEWWRQPTKCSIVAVVVHTTIVLFCTYSDPTGNWVLGFQTVSWDGSKWSWNTCCRPWMGACSDGMISNSHS